MRFYASYQTNPLYSPKSRRYFAFPSKKARENFLENNTSFFQGCKRSDVVKACGKNFQIFQSATYEGVLICEHQDY